MRTVCMLLIAVLQCVLDVGGRNWMFEETTKQGIQSEFRPRINWFNNKIYNIQHHLNGNNFFFSKKGHVFRSGIHPAEEDVIYIKELIKSSSIEISNTDVSLANDLFDLAVQNVDSVSMFSVQCVQDIEKLVIGVILKTTRLALTNVLKGKKFARNSIKTIISEDIYNSTRNYMNKTISKIIDHLDTSLVLNKWTMTKLSKITFQAVKVFKDLKPLVDNGERKLVEQMNMAHEKFLSFRPTVYKYYYALGNTSKQAINNIISISLGQLEILVNSEDDDWNFLIRIQELHDNLMQSLPEIYKVIKESGVKIKNTIKLKVENLVEDLKTFGEKRLHCLFTRKYVTKPLGGKEYIFRD